MTEQEERDMVVAEVRSWIGTPYHHMACVKGAGVDCGQIIKATYEATGMIETFVLQKYTHDWHMHRDEEAYLGSLTKYLDLLTPDEKTLDERAEDPDFHPLPGDVIMFKIGRTYSHGCMVTEWPLVVHANYGSDCVEEIIATGTAMARRKCQVYSLWEAKKRKAKSRKKGS